jgi:tRNA (cmo5U34)-methyltransferase
MAKDNAAGPKPIWDARTFDEERQRLVPLLDVYYGIVAALVGETCGATPRVLDLGAGTGLLSAAIVRTLPGARLHLLDSSPEMLDRARARFDGRADVAFTEQEMTAPLPPGQFDAVVSALAIHHLEHGAKRDLFARIRAVLAPGGVFANAEQVLGPSAWHEARYDDAWARAAHAAGSSAAEIDAARSRMVHDRCATAEDQLRWLVEAGFERADCWFKLYRFAVLAGWRPA